jgi:hypothetical protein
MSYASPTFQQGKDSFENLIFLYDTVYKKIIFPNKSMNIIYGKTSAGIEESLFSEDN